METGKPGRPKELDRPKNKFTLYMTKEVEHMFNRLYAFRVMAGSKDKKSDILCEAVKLLHDSIFSKLESKGKEE